MTYTSNLWLNYVRLNVNDISWPIKIQSFSFYYYRSSFFTFLFFCCSFLLPICLHQQIFFSGPDISGIVQGSGNYEDDWTLYLPSELSLLPSQSYSFSLHPFFPPLYCTFLSHGFHSSTWFHWEYNLSSLCYW